MTIKGVVRPELVLVKGERGREGENPASSATERALRDIVSTPATDK
jgi:hypothetical protein